MRIKLYKLYFQLSHFSFQPNKAIFTSLLLYSSNQILTNLFYLVIFLLFHHFLVIYFFTI